MYDLLQDWEGLSVGCCLEAKPDEEDMRRSEGSPGRVKSEYGGSKGDDCCSRLPSASANGVTKSECISYRAQQSGALFYKLHEPSPFLPRISNLYRIKAV